MQKILKAKDVFIMSIAANLGPRWIAVAAALGPVSLLFWFLGAAFFLLPFSLIVIEFATRYPQEGGICVWVDKTLGPKASFIVSWCYWVNNFFFYPAILTFFSTSFVYAFGRPDLAQNTPFITCTVIVVFWVILFLTLQGIRMSKVAGLFGGIGSFLVFGILIILGISSLLVFHKSHTSFTLSSFLPSGSLSGNLSSLSLLMFALAGVEIIPTLSNSIERPEKALPKALTVFAFVLFFIYALATLSMQVILSPDEIKDTTGLMEAFHLVGEKFGLVYLARFIAFFISVSELMALMLWILVPAVMFFKDTRKEILPLFFHRENKHGIPANALLLEGVLVSFIILATSFLPSVNLMYQTLMLMTTIIYFIPYLLVIVAYVCFKRKGGQGSYVVPGGKKGAFFLSALVFCSLIFAILVSFIPTSNLKGFKEIFIYESELLIGTLATLVIGLLLYRRKQN